MTSHLLEAIQTFVNPRLRPKLDKMELEGRMPTPEEETAMRGNLECAHIPEYQWPLVVALSDRFRQTRAELALTDDAREQIAGAERFLDLRPNDFLRWPWKSLDDAVGGMAPGTLHYIVCPSKGGKTTLMRSATAAWCKQGKKILYGGFEMKAETLRTMYAADDCGMDPGDVLSGNWHTFEHYADLRERMVKAYREQDNPTSFYQNLRFTGFDTVGTREIQSMMEQAHDWGADAVIVDHVDEIVGTERATDYQVSVQVNRLLQSLAKRYGLKVIATSQTNNTGKSTDRWRDHRNLRDEIVRYGDLKKQVATTMIGLFRPVKPWLTKEEKQQVEAGEKPMSEVLLPYANKHILMASRTYGSKIGNVGYLGWERGRIVDAPAALMAEIEARKHGIKTNRDI